MVKLLLNQENILEFGLSGSLIEDRLSKTIVDAMTFCSRMGERYLWVDQLCIQQDSILDRMRKISRMHLIYSQAASTTIASSGANSDSGLPGLHSDRIKQTQTTVFVPYHPLSESESIATTSQQQQAIDKVRLTLMATHSSQMIDSGHFLGTEPWYGRGWTMQERVLSSINLIVTNKQVYWECSEASYCEESWMNFWKPPRFFRNSREPSLLAPEFVTESWKVKLQQNDNREATQDASSTEVVNTSDALHANIWETKLSHNHCFRHFSHLIMRYSQRNFMVERNVAVGFLGITSALSERSNKLFVWGLPISWFEICLLWFGYSGPMRPTKAIVPVSEVDIAEETENEVRQEETGGSMMVTIPSWS